MIQFLKTRLNISQEAERIIFNVGLVITLIAIIFMAIVVAWIVQPTKVISINNEPIPTIKDGTHAGNTVIFKIIYCKETSQTGMVNWYIVGNHTVTLLPSYTDVTQKSCGTVLDPVIVPLSLQPGIYYIVWQVTYPINPLKQDYTEFRSRDFDVIK